MPDEHPPMSARQFAAKRQRLTRQRQAILDLLAATDSHPDASWLYQELRKQLPHISLGTIYRNLAVLKAAGLVRELHLGQALGRYDAQTSEHYHAVCARCSRIDNVHVPPGELRDLLAGIAARSGYLIRGLHLEFYGLCQACQAAEG